MVVFAVGLVIGFMGTIVVRTVMEKRRNEVRTDARDSASTTAATSTSSTLEPDSSQNPYFKK